MTVQAVVPTAAQAKQREPGIVAQLASRYKMDPRALQQTLVATVFPGGKATPEQVAAFAAVAWEHQLNPFLKQIYAFPEKGGGIIPIVSVDGWYAIANRQTEFDGIEFEILEGDDGQPVACTATVWRKDRSHPVRITEYVSECKRNTGPWNTQTRRMIRHRTAIQAFRIAFGISALDPDEAERIPEYEAQASTPAKVHDVTLADAKGRLGKAMAEEEARGKPAAPPAEPAEERSQPPPTMPAEPFEPPEEPQRKRRSKAVKDQRMEFSAYVKDGTIDTARISPLLPKEGDTEEQAFACMWSTDAEEILARCRAGEFSTPGIGGGEPGGGGQEHEPTFEGPQESDFPV